MLRYKPSYSCRKCVVCNSHVSSSHSPFLVQVTLPVAITPQRSHCAVVFGYGTSFRAVVLFGGFKLKGYTTSAQGGFLSETTLLMLGEYTMSATEIL